MAGKLCLSLTSSSLLVDCVTRSQKSEEKMRGCACFIALSLVFASETLKYLNLEETYFDLYSLVGTTAILFQNYQKSIDLERVVFLD